MRHIVGATALLIDLAAFGSSPCAQETCNNIPSGGGEDVVGYITKQDGSCSVTADTYVKANVGYKVDAVANAYGQCTLRTWDCAPLPCVCVTYGTQERGVAGVGCFEYNSNPGSPYSIGPIYPVNAQGQIIRVHEMDSRVSGTTTSSRNWTPAVALGSVTIKWKEIIYTTNCNILPSEKWFEMPVNVVKCTPKFNKDASSGNIIKLSPGTTTYIYINPNLGPKITGAINLAIQDWNNSQPYVPLAPTNAPCAGGHCINTNLGSVPSGACAKSDILHVDGTITGSTMIFPSAATGWNDPFLRRLVNHELGHHLGLKEQSSCGTNDSVMTPTACNATSGFPQTPTINDTLPVNHSSYGSGPTTSCPAQ